MREYAQRLPTTTLTPVASVAQTRMPVHDRGSGNAAACIQAQHDCRGDQLLANELPRRRELSSEVST